VGTALEAIREELGAVRRMLRVRLPRAGSLFSSAGHAWAPANPAAGCIAPPSGGGRGGGRGVGSGGGTGGLVRLARELESAGWARAEVVAGRGPVEPAGSGKASPSTAAAAAAAAAAGGESPAALRATVYDAVRDALADLLPAAGPTSRAGAGPGGPSAEVASQVLTPRVLTVVALRGDPDRPATVDGAGGPAAAWRRPPRSPATPAGGLWGGGPTGGADTSTPLFDGSARQGSRIGDGGSSSISDRKRSGFGESRASVIVPPGRVSWKLEEVEAGRSVAVAAAAASPGRAARSVRAGLERHQAGVDGGSSGGGSGGGGGGVKGDRFGPAGARLVGVVAQTEGGRDRGRYISIQMVERLRGGLVGGEQVRSRKQGKDGERNGRRAGDGWTAGRKRERRGNRRR
jgi:hypothetical protein